jgi:hypothetical protein
VTYATVAADVHETLDVHLHFAPQRTFDLVIGRDDAPDALHFIIRQIVDLLIDIHSRLRQNCARCGVANAVDVGQTDLRTLLFGQVDSRYTSHAYSPLALTLFVLGIGADHPHHTFPPDDLAVPADLLYG